MAQHPTTPAELKEGPSTMGSKKSRGRSSRLVFVMASISIVLLVVLIWTTVRNDEIQTQLQTAQLRMDELEQHTAMLERIIQIDGSVIVDRDPQAAMAEYNKIVGSLPPERAAAIQQRINRLSARLASREMPNTGTDDSDPLMQDHQARIQELERSLAEINNRFLQTQDSMRSEKDDLLVSLAKAKRELQSKERTQVISFTGTKGHKINYLGEVQNGKAHGGGVGIWSTGSVYRGNWVRGVRHGKGVFEWEDGQRYEGEYVNGIREGQGTYYWPGGDRYEGEWRDDKRNGHGILYDMDGNIRFEGEWMDDKPVGGKS